jgi:protoporphyrin/coproporphyrin ferrochelatase
MTDTTETSSPETPPPTPPAAEAVAPPAPVAPEPVSHRPADHPAVPSGRIGVLLVNLGTPEGTDAASVRTYLREFLSDKRVIEQDTLLWKLVLHGIILRFRPRRKGRDYAKIWNTDKNESPLKTITRSQTEKLASILKPLGDNVVVDWAMRYGKPSIVSRIDALHAQGCERILVVPLYPQYAAATTATVCDEVFRALMKLRWQPALRVAAPYYADPVYIEAISGTLESELQRLPFKPDVILASFHGLPKSYFLKGDPYYCHCAKTTRLVRDRLKLNEDAFRMTFQSRFGREPWLQPYTDMTVKALAKQGVKNLAVITPGFAADCLETLEEIAVENAHIFKKHGGENFTLIPCLNDSDPGMTVIWTTVMRELKGWI